MSNLFESFLNRGVAQPNSGEAAPKPSSAVTGTPGQKHGGPSEANASRGQSIPRPPVLDAVSTESAGLGHVHRPVNTGSPQIPRAHPVPTGSKNIPSPYVTRVDQALPVSMNVPPRSTSKSVQLPMMSESKTPFASSIPSAAKALGLPEEKIMDIDSLKQFTIPKKKKAKRDLYDKISLTSPEYTRELLPLVTKTYKDAGSPKVFSYTRPVLVHNSDLLDAYLDRRKEWRQEGYSDKDIIDSYGFLCVESNAEMKQICEEGISTGSGSANNILGCSSMGVYLSRHADIIRPNGMSNGYQGKLIVFKFMKGKVKSLMENRGGVALEPTPNFDCHVSKNFNVDLSSTSPSVAFESTQVYIYEYGDLGPEERPRQIYPYAVLNFTYTGSRSAAPGRQSKSRTSSQRVAAASVPKLLALSVAGDSKPSPSPTDTFPIPSPPVRSPLTPGSKKSKDKTPATTVGQSVDGNGCVVWEGKLLSKGTAMCGVELVTYGQAVRPACIGPSLNIVSRIPLGVVRTKYLVDIGSLRKDAELCASGKWYRYSLLRPARDSISKFNQVMTYLLRKESAALVKLDGGTQVILLTNCDITQKLGLSEARSHPLVLHLLFIASTARTEKLQRIGQENTVGDGDHRPTDPTFKEPPQVNRLVPKTTSTDTNYENGFQKLVSADSLLYRPAISKGFIEQTVLQECVNVERGCGQLNITAKNMQPSAPTSVGYGQGVHSTAIVAGGMQAPSTCIPPPDYHNQQYVQDGMMYQGQGQMHAQPSLLGMPPTDYPPGSMAQPMNAPGMNPLVSPQRMGMMGYGQNQSPGLGFSSDLTGHNFSPGMMPPMNNNSMPGQYNPYAQQYPMGQAPQHYLMAQQQNSVLGYGSTVANPNLPKSLSAGLPLNLGAPPPPPPPPPPPTSAPGSMSGSSSQNSWTANQMPRPAEGPSSISVAMAEVEKQIEIEKAAVSSLGQSWTTVKTKLSAKHLPLPPGLSNSDSDSEGEAKPVARWKGRQLEMTDALADIIVRSAPLAAKAVREYTRKDPRLHRNTPVEPEEKASKENAGPVPKRDPHSQSSATLKPKENLTNVEVGMTDEVIDSAQDMKALLDEALDVPKTPPITPEKDEMRRQQRMRLRKQMQGARREQAKTWLSMQPTPRTPEPPSVVTALEPGPSPTRNTALHSDMDSSVTSPSTTTALATTSTTIAHIPTTTPVSARTTISTPVPTTAPVFARTTISTPVPTTAPVSARTTISTPVPTTAPVFARTTISTPVPTTAPVFARTTISIPVPTTAPVSARTTVSTSVSTTTPASARTTISTPVSARTTISTPGPTTTPVSARMTISTPVPTAAPVPVRTTISTPIPTAAPVPARTAVPTTVPVPAWTTISTPIPTTAPIPARMTISTPTINAPKPALTPITVQSAVSAQSSSVPVPVSPQAPVTATSTSPDSLLIPVLVAGNVQRPSLVTPIPGPDIGGGGVVSGRLRHPEAGPTLHPIGRVVSPGSERFEPVQSLLQAGRGKGGHGSEKSPVFGRDSQTSGHLEEARVGHSDTVVPPTEGLSRIEVICEKSPKKLIPETKFGGPKGNLIYIQTTQDFPSTSGSEDNSSSTVGKLAGLAEPLDLEIFGPIDTDPEDEPERVAPSSPVLDIRAPSKADGSPTLTRISTGGLKPLSITLKPIPVMGKTFTGTARPIAASRPSRPMAGGATRLPDRTSSRKLFKFPIRKGSSGALKSPTAKGMEVASKPDDGATRTGSIPERAATFDITEELDFDMGELDVPGAGKQVSPVSGVVQGANILSKHLPYVQQTSQAELHSERVDSVKQVDSIEGNISFESERMQTDMTKTHESSLPVIDRDSQVHKMVVVSATSTHSTSPGVPKLPQKLEADGEQGPAAPSPKKLSSLWIQRLANITQKMIGGKETLQLPPQTLTKDNEATSQVIVPLHNIDGPVFLPHAKVEVGTEVEDVRVHFRQETLPSESRSALSTLPEEDHIEASCLIAMHRNFTTETVDDAESDEDQSLIFIWFYGLHLLPSDLSRARNKENIPPSSESHQQTSKVISERVCSVYPASVSSKKELLDAMCHCSGDRVHLASCVSFSKSVGVTDIDVVKSGDCTLTEESPASKCDLPQTVPATSDPVTPLLGASVSSEQEHAQPIKFPTTLGQPAVECKSPSVVHIRKITEIEDIGDLKKQTLSPKLIWENLYSSVEQPIGTPAPEDPKGKQSEIPISPLLEYKKQTEKSSTENKRSSIVTPTSELAKEAQPGISQRQLKESKKLTEKSSARKERIPIPEKAGEKRTEKSLIVTHLSELAKETRSDILQPSKDKKQTEKNSDQKEKLLSVTPTSGKAKETLLEISQSLKDKNQTEKSLGRKENLSIVTALSERAKETLSQISLQPSKESKKQTETSSDRKDNSLKVTASSEKAKETLSEVHQSLKEKKKLPEKSSDQKEASLKVTPPSSEKVKETLLEVSHQSSKEKKKRLEKSSDRKETSLKVIPSSEKAKETLSEVSHQTLKENKKRTAKSSDQKETSLELTPSFEKAMEILSEVSHQSSKEKKKRLEKSSDRKETSLKVMPLSEKAKETLSEVSHQSSKENKKRVEKSSDQKETSLKVTPSEKATLTKVLHQSSKENKKQEKSSDKKGKSSSAATASQSCKPAKDSKKPKQRSSDKKDESSNKKTKRKKFWYERTKVQKYLQPVVRLDKSVVEHYIQKQKEAQRLKKKENAIKEKVKANKDKKRQRTSSIPSDKSSPRRHHKRSRKVTILDDSILDKQDTDIIRGNYKSVRDEHSRKRTTSERSDSERSDAGTRDSKNKDRGDQSYHRSKKRHRSASSTSSHSTTANSPKSKRKVVLCQSPVSKSSPKVMSGAMKGSFLEYKSQLSDILAPKQTGIRSSKGPAQTSNFKIGKKLPGINRIKSENQTGSTAEPNLKSLNKEVGNNVSILRGLKKSDPATIVRKPIKHENSSVEGNKKGVNQKKKELLSGEMTPALSESQTVLQLLDEQMPLSPVHVTEPEVKNKVLPLSVLAEMALERQAELKSPVSQREVKQVDAKIQDTQVSSSQPLRSQVAVTAATHSEPQATTQSHLATYLQAYQNLIANFAGIAPLINEAIGVAPGVSPLPVDNKASIEPQVSTEHKLKITIVKSKDEEYSVKPLKTEVGTPSQSPSIVVDPKVQQAIVGSSGMTETDQPVQTLKLEDISLPQPVQPSLRLMDIPLPVAFSQGSSDTSAVVKTVVKSEDSEPLVQTLKLEEIRLPEPFKQVFTEPASKSREPTQAETAVQEPQRPVCFVRVDKEPSVMKPVPDPEVTAKARDKHDSSSRSHSSSRSRHDPRRRDEGSHRSERGSDRYHPYRRPRLPPATPELDRLKQYNTDLSHHDLLECLTSSSYRARRQVTHLRANDPLPPPHFLDSRFQRSIWEDDDPDEDMRANSLREDPNEVDQSYTQTNVEDFERRRVLCLELDTLLEDSGEQRVPDSVDTGGSGTAPSGIGEEKAVLLPDDIPANIDQHPTIATRGLNADDDTLIVVSSNSTLAKKKKKKAKWPGLQYEVAVPQTRHVYHPNPSQPEQLQLLDSVVIDDNDPRQAADLPETSIYARPSEEAAESANQTPLVADSADANNVSEEKIPLKTKSPAVPILTVSLENDLHETPKETDPEKTENTQELPISEVKIPEDNEQRKRSKQKQQEPQESEKKKDSDQAEMGAINDANNASFEKNKVHNWIKSSQKYFPDSSHEGDSEPPEAEDAADLYAGALTENKTRTSPSHAKRSHTKNSQLRRSLDGNEGQQEKANHENEENMKSLTSDTVKNALQGFVDDEKSLLNKMKPRTVHISNQQSSKLSKPAHMGRLSASTQELANNSDAVEAVFSALHKTRDEVTKTLTDEVKRSGPPPMKISRKPQPAAYDLPNRGISERKDISSSGSKREVHNSSYEDDRECDQTEPAIEHQRVLPEDTSKEQSHRQGYESGELEDTVEDEVAEEIVTINSRSRRRSREDRHAVQSRSASAVADEEQQYQLQRRSHDNVEKTKHKRRSEGSSGRKCKGRHRRPVDEERWSATHEKLNGISDYTYALAKGLEKDAYKKGIDKLVKQNRKGMIRSLNSLCKGEPFDFSEALLDEDFNHFDGLSLGTQLECTFTPESNMVKRAHYDVLKDWLTKKPLDSYLVGKYDISDLNIDEIKPSLKIDETVRECLSEFSEGVFELMKVDNEPVQHSNVFPKPKNDTEETVDKVFRQVHQYMDFVVSQAEHSNRQSETHVNGYSTPPDDDIDRLSPKPEVNHERPGSASSSEGVENNELSDEGRGRKKSRHKHKKKKRKHKKSSKSPDKRRKQRFVDYPSTDEESDASEPPSTKRKLNDSPEKDCYKPSNTPAKKKTTTGAPPKGIREQGMTHIMEEFYGDVESLLNNSDVSLDGITPADQHLPPLQGLLSESVKDPHVDSMIKEEMTKTKQHLLNIMPDLKSKKKPEASALSIENKTAGILCYPKTNSIVDTVNRKQDVNSLAASSFRMQNYVPRQETASTENSVGRGRTGSNFETRITDKNSNVPPSPERERLPPREEEPRRPEQMKKALQSEVPRNESEESSVPPWRRRSAERSERIVNSSQSDRSSYARASERHVSRSISPSHRKSIKRKYSSPPREFRLKKQTKPLVEPEPEPPAPKVDMTYVDSFSSKLVDPYGETPVPNFEPFFDVTKAPQGHFVNPFNHWWSIMQYFLDESRTDCDMKYLEKCVPGWNKCSMSGVLPENSFLLALSFATGKMPHIDSVDKKIATDDALEFADVGGDMNEYGSTLGANEDSTVTRTRTISVNSSGSATESTSVGEPSTGDDSSRAKGANRLPKRVNTLALAFKQAVEAKKQAAQNGSATTVKIPLLRKMKTRPIRTRLKSTPSKADNKPQPKTPDPSTAKDVRPIPYGEDASDVADAAPATGSPKKVPLNTYFEPELNSRIHSVMEEAMHDFVSNLRSSVKNSLGQLSWNQTILPPAFYNPPNQVRHLMALSGQAQGMFEKLRDNNKSKWTFSKTNAAVQTDCSKIPARKNSSGETPAIPNPVPVVDMQPKEKPEERSQIASSGRAIQERDAVPVGDMHAQMGNGHVQPVVEKPTAQIADLSTSIPAPDPSEVDMDIPNSPEAATVSKEFFGNDVAPVSTVSPNTVQQASIPLTSTESTVQTTSLSTTPTMVPPVRTAVIAPALPTLSPSQRQSQVVESRFSSEISSASSDLPALKHQVVAPVSQDPSPPMMQMASNKNVSDAGLSSAERLSSPITDSSMRKTHFSKFVIAQTPNVATNSETSNTTVATKETTASGSFTQIAAVSIPSEPVRSLAPVKFSLFKSSPSLSQKPATFIPVATTIAPLPFVELPPITAEALAPITSVSASSVSNEPIPSVPEPPVPPKSDTPDTSSTESGAAVPDPAASVVAASTVTTSGDVNVPIVEAEEKPHKTEVSSYMQTPRLGLVSFDHVEIPGFGAPEEAAPPPVPETPAVSDAPAPAVDTTPSSADTFSTSSPATISAPPVLSTPITTSNLTEIPTDRVPPATSFSLDAIPLPPAGKTSENSKSSKWQEWKKQKEEEWRKQAEVVQDVGELTQWPPPDWRKQVEPAPPVSTLTEWPPKLATDNIPPPPLPPILQTEWSTPQSADTVQQQQQQQQPPPPQYPQGWYQGPQYRPPWQGGWGPRGPPPPGWGGWHGGQWRQWGPRHHGPRGPWERPPHPGGYWEHPQHHGPHWGAGDQQQNNPQGEWRDGSYHHQGNWYQQPPGWGPPQPHADPSQPPYPESAPELPSHGPPPLPPDEPIPPPENDWQVATPEPPPPPIAAPGEDVTKPVTLGTERSENPLPAGNIRMLVFNQDQPICKSVQRFMSFLGAKSFDPYNIMALQAIPSVETLVMVQVEDVKKIHEVPNLLALKTQEWVRFVAYDSMTDVQHKKYTVILKAGGIAVPDDSILLSLQPESLETICEYMVKQRRAEGGEPWYLMVHNHVVNKLQNAREDDRMRQLHMILTRYEEEGVVRVMRSPTFDNNPLPPHEYLSLMLRLQAQYAYATRHTVLLTDLPQSDVRTLPFLRQGISVMNVSSFMRVIVGATALPPIPQAKPYYGLKTDDLFLDSYLSSCEDLLPPMLAANLMEATQSQSADTDNDC